MHENPQRTQKVIDTLFAMKTPPDRPISLHVTGTNFQISVWETLLHIPLAAVVSYSQVADAIGHHNAARSVRTRSPS